MTLAIVILTLVTLQRGAELVLAASNTRRLRALGAVEVGQAHYPPLVLLHAAWLGALWAAAPARAVHVPLLAVFVVLQALRVWVLWTLGQRWTTRIMVVPGAPLVRTGPFRFARHPNYCIVAAEIAVLPLAFGLVWIALIFTVLNVVMLWVRIRAETQALYGPGATSTKFAARPPRAAPRARAAADWPRSPPN